MPRKSFPVKERQTGIYSFAIKDEAQAAIPAAQLTTLTLTLESVEDGLIVNARDGQNALNANNVTVDAAGIVMWTIQELDMAMIDTTRSIEVHRALFVFTWGSGRKQPHEVDFAIENLRRVF